MVKNVYLQQGRGSGEVGRWGLGAMGSVGSGGVGERYLSVSSLSPLSFLFSVCLLFTYELN
ncbi:MAG: hypothetical protein C4323_10890 [Mastigocladus sp. ERB_26_2]